MKKHTDLSKLPERIAISVKRGRSGCFLIDLPEYKLYTEADDPLQICKQINDLIFAYFDIPKKYWGKIGYFPSATEDLSTVHSSAHYTVPLFVIPKLAGFPCVSA